MLIAPPVMFSLQKLYTSPVSVSVPPLVTVSTRFESSVTLLQVEQLSFGVVALPVSARVMRMLSFVVRVLPWLTGWNTKGVVAGAVEYPAQTVVPFPAE